MFIRKAPVIRMPEPPTGGDAFIRSPLRWIVDVFGIKRAPTALNVTSPIQVVTEARQGRIVYTRPGDVAAGVNNVNMFVPANEEWDFLSLGFQVVTDANAANRIVVVLLAGPIEGATIPIWYRANGNFSQVTGTTIGYTAAPHGVVGQTSSVALTEDSILVPMPIGARLLPGHRVRIFVANYQVGDVIQNIALMVRAFDRVAA